MSAEPEESRPGEAGRREHLEGLLSRLSGHIDSERLRGLDAESRSSERRPAKLIFEYRMTGDERSYGGRVLDISRGGLRCVVSEPLSPGDVLAISIKSPNPGVIEGRIDAYGEVVRLKRRGSIFELGVQFVRPTAAKELPAERRHHRRADVEFGLTVRTGDGRRELASVRNISAGGLSFSSGSAFDVGEEVALSLGPRRSPGAEGALSSVARIIRVRRLGGHYEVAASFLG